MAAILGVMGFALLQNLCFQVKMQGVKRNLKSMLDYCWHFEKVEKEMN